MRVLILLGCSLFLGDRRRILPLVAWASGSKPMPAPREVAARPYVSPARRAIRDFYGLSSH